ncbi:MAG: hypothetical protein A2Z20_04130 [Bdellovibrionales bacterium RBG_16_40_8]|nr:MAG: hypothetical protein A2Z20_04130 [Bdellovibrionales bacterium RBG_16_40_8]
MVEGHTDSIGSPSFNQKLSQRRAAAVAKYFQTNGLEGAKIDSIGYDCKKPIATNKAAAGRKQNCRVDIVIAPSATSL